MQLPQQAGGAAEGPPTRPEPGEQGLAGRADRRVLAVVAFPAEPVVQERVAALAIAPWMRAIAAMGPNCARAPDPAVVCQ
ncbi:hypothetical protein ACFWXK_10985 [Streptomyces sp. NPDC059070]|uniref:hypothetical protein n=1 Tax=Streptomyces sp. NPDC059070 TaxID=3346713 RepID=UPI00369AACF2